MLIFVMGLNATGVRKVHTHTHAYTNIDFSHSSAGCFQDSGDETSNLFMQKKKNHIYSEIKFDFSLVENQQ